MEEIIVPNGDVEQMAWRDARRVVVVVLRAWRRNLQVFRSVLGSRAGSVGTDRSGGCGAYRAAVQAGLKLLIGRQNGGVP